MVFELLACVLLAGILAAALLNHVISVFLFLFSLSALLAVFGLVPASAWGSVLYLAASASWVEFAQIEGSSKDNDCDKEALSPALAGALLGLTAGAGLWYLGRGPAPIPILTAFWGAFFMSLVAGGGPRRSLERALYLPETGTAGVLLKICFCAVLLGSLCMK